MCTDSNHTDTSPADSLDEASYAIETLTDGIEWFVYSICIGILNAVAEADKLPDQTRLRKISVSMGELVDKDIIDQARSEYKQLDDLIPKR